MGFLFPEIAIFASMTADELIRYASPFNFLIWGLMVCLLIIAIVFLWKQTQRQAIGNETLIRIEAAIIRQNEKHDGLQKEHDELKIEVKEVHEIVRKLQYQFENSKK